MSRNLCIHGHFYQPPREDPWLGRIFIEPSAAPMRHWNERIVHESYAPLGWARRLGEGGRITDLMNCYEWISFNVGPTLMSWLERHEPEVYARILEADAASVARWGHGNAMAQIYHHVIMPLATPIEKEVETAWAIADFTARFKRAPEGMWLSECAVDVATLEVLAAAGIRYVSLAPRQAEAVADAQGVFKPVSEVGLDIHQPYTIDLPSGASIAVFFYDGALSQGIAFEGLLKDGEHFWSRIRDTSKEGILSLSTDGETYGHHFAFGEMALAHVLAQGASGRDGINLCNFGSYLATNPPTRKVRLHEPSSWSCVHGVERWRSNCGCKDGGHPDWNQEWRGPLRTALTKVKENIDKHFFALGGKYFYDTWKALRDYGAVMATPSSAPAFIEKHVLSKDTATRDTIWKLLAMQEQSLAAFASCAWFFDDISRIEPVNGMTFMLRAMELAAETGAPDLLPLFEQELARAQSNNPAEGSGRDILHKRVLPRRQDAASLVLMALVSLECEGRLPPPGVAAEESWPQATVSVMLTPGENMPAPTDMLHGSASIRTSFESEGASVSWQWLPSSSRSACTEACWFVPLSDSHVVVTLADGQRISRKVSGLPRHLRDYLSLSEIMHNTELLNPRMLAVARHTLSLLSPWEEGQHSLPYLWDWAGLGPYVIFACVVEDSVTDATRAQVAGFLAGLNLPISAQEKAGRLVEKLLMEELLIRSKNAPSTISNLAAWVYRVRKFVPNLSLWAVQNKVWQMGSKNHDLKALAEALGFAL